MKLNRDALLALVLSGLFLVLLSGSGGVTSALAQDIVVSSANPPSAPQGTINLNVTIGGKGFKRGAKAKFFVTGTTNPGGITVNSTAFVGPTQLVANITVSDIAVVSNFDIQVQNSDGRTGKGIELFSVTSKNPNQQPPPDPAIVFNIGSPMGGSIYVMNDDGTNRRAIVPQGRNGMPSWSPDGSQVVFASDVKKKGIYIVNTDGSGLCKLTSLNDSNLWIYAGPVWSPLPLADGKFKILYANTPSPGATTYDLFVVNADCSNPGTPVNLTNTPKTSEWFPSWSRFANRIAAQDDATQDVVIYDIGVNVDGIVSVSNKIHLRDQGSFPLTDPGVVRVAYEPDWDKVQDRLAVDSHLDVAYDWPQIWITNFTTAGTYNLTQGKVASASQPSWSADGTQIVFLQSNTADGTPIGLFKINVATGAVVQLTGLSYTDIKGSYPDWRRCFRSSTQCPPGSTCQLCK